jgi:hypothetical protein
MKQDPLDFAHLAFLESIRAQAGQMGVPGAKGVLMRAGKHIGLAVKPVDFQTFDDFVKSMEGAENSLARLEGKPVYFGDGLFGLPACPFAASLASYGEVFESVPECYADITQDYNKPNPLTEQLHVGYGAGVSALCAVHQPMRASAGQRITIGGKPLVVYQLGCKSKAGVKALADRWIAEGGWTAESVTRILETNMCCYGIKVSA